MLVLNWYWCFFRDFSTCKDSKIGWLFRWLRHRAASLCITVYVYKWLYLLNCWYYCNKKSTNCSRHYYLMIVSGFQIHHITENGQNAKVVHSVFIHTTSVVVKLLSLYQTRSVSNSRPDLNPIDYLVWAALEQKVYHGFKITNIQDLKLKNHCFLNLPFPVPFLSGESACLQTVVERDGGHTEHILHY